MSACRHGPHYSQVFRIWKGRDAFGESIFGKMMTARVSGLDGGL